MSGIAIAGTLASTRALFGLRHVFPQSSILYGPLPGNSSSAFPADIGTVPAAPAAAAIALRRMMVRSIVDMPLSPFSSVSDALHNGALSAHVPEAKGRGSLVTKMVSRTMPVDNLGGNQCTPSIGRGELIPPDPPINAAAPVRSRRPPERSTREQAPRGSRQSVCRKLS